jgi:RNA polymerase sigma-70 factor (ECF subfamily)
MQTNSPGATLPGSRGTEREERFNAARSGDPLAFTMLVEQVSPRIEGSLRRFLRGDADAASAALQDAWMAAWQQWSEFNSGEHLVRCLHRVARCKATSHIRKVRRLKFTPWPDPLANRRSPPPDSMRQRGIGSEAREAVRSAVAHLPDAYRGVATLHYLDGLPLREVSGLLDLPVGALKMRLHRARVRLRRSLRSTPSL